MSSNPFSGHIKPPRSRFSCAGADEWTFRFETVRELGAERSLIVDGQRLRVGIANTHWQLQQARLLLEALQPIQRPQPLGLESRNQAIALALKIAPSNRQPRAQALLAVRCDSDEGLLLDQRHREALDQLREGGGRLIEIELVAFDRVLELEPLLRAMASALRGPVESWAATDILAECPREHAGVYCRLLGFRRLGKQAACNSKLLLALSAERLRSRLGALG